MNQRCTDAGGEKCEQVSRCSLHEPSVQPVATNHKRVAKVDTTSITCSQKYSGPEQSGVRHLKHVDVAATNRFEKFHVNLSVSKLLNFDLYQRHPQ